VVFGESAATSTEAGAQVGIFEQAFQAGSDLQGTTVPQQETLFPVCEVPPNVGVRQDNGPSHREKLADLCRKSVVIEGIRAAWLDERIGEGKVPRNLHVRPVADVDDVLPQRS
jgi:hypothetical protein